MILPKRRERQRSGIQRAPRRVWPRHERWIRSLTCSVLACPSAVELIPIECAHVRTGTDGGTSIKPSSWWTLPLCRECHHIQHHIGEAEFEKRNAIDMKRIALALAKQSPDTAMRDAMREAGL